MDRVKIESYRNSQNRNENEYLKGIFLENGNRWVKCLCNSNNRAEFNKAFFNWYDRDFNR